MRFKLYRENGALNSPPVFDAFAQGLKRLGHSIVDGGEDVAVIWSVLWNGRMAPNKLVYETCRKNKRPIIIIEVGNLFRNTTWRICLNHINGLGEFGNTINLDSDRPNKLGININPINLNRKQEILIATQHDKSLQWENMPSMTNWTLSMIEKIRQKTNMRINIRPHPRSPMPGIEHEFKNVYRQSPKKLTGTYDDFDIDYDYHCVINHNSGPTIHAALAGTPVISHESSLAFPVSDSIENIINPTLPDREEWIIRLSHTEWTVDEISKGIPIKRLENLLEKQINT